PPMAAIEQQLHFAELDPPTEQLTVRAGPALALAPINEFERIPPAAQLQSQLGRIGCERLVHRVRLDSRKRVRGVARMRFTAVHDPVLVGTDPSGQVLADGVRLVTKVVVQPEATEAAERGFSIPDCRKDSFHTNG